MTYGELKLRITQHFPGVGPEIVEGAIGDVYADILHELPWQRQNVTGILQTVAPYATGTVTMNVGANTVTGSGTAFTALMTGRAFRVTGRDELYELTYVSSTNGTLDRLYEGPTAAGLAYKIFQFVFLLPADCRLLEDNAFPGLTRAGRGELSTLTYGPAGRWSSYMDDNSSPPRMQVQIEAIPDTTTSYPFTYAAEAPSLSGTSVTMLPWVQPSCLVEGVMAKLCASPAMKDYTGAAFHKIAAADALKIMRRAEANGLAPAEMKMSPAYTQHRWKRWNR